MHHGAVVKRITISLEDDLYRVAKSYAISEDISLSKAITFLLRRGVEGGRPAENRAGEEAGPYRYKDPRTGILVSRGRGTITEDAVKLAEEEDDMRAWDCE